ncbi:AB-hydrolase YheT [Mycena sp. CBHHK59/15]|nr:AB-hydrolase YheT [Mycena sp. CBHHK59/15]
MGALFSVASGRRNKPPLLHFPDNPAVVALRQSFEDRSTTTECPSLRSNFSPAWWLFNGHLQTIYCVLGDFTKRDRLQYNRKFIRLLEGGTLGLDFAPADFSQVREDAPIIVVLHGLTGGSYESYVRSILVPACKAIEEGGLGYRAVVVNFRGCAGVPITSPQLYSAGYTDDIRQALVYISNLYPRATLLGLGFSLGANVLIRYLAEEGEQSRLSSGCALACPWDLAKNNDGAASLEKSFIGNFYSRAMATNLINLLRRNLDGLTKYPDSEIAKATPGVLAMKNSTLENFDDAFTRIAGGAPPQFPFATAQDYYKWASSHIVVRNVRRPFLAINAADDPVVQHVPMDAGGNPMAIMALTSSGGHLGWFQAGSARFTVERWIVQPVLEWMSLVGDVLAPSTERAPRIYLEDDFYREEGRNGGCKELGGCIIDASSWQGATLLQGL